MSRKNTIHNLMGRIGAAIDSAIMEDDGVDTSAVLMALILETMLRMHSYVFGQEVSREQIMPDEWANEEESDVG